MAAVAFVGTQTTQERLKPTFSIPQFARGRNPAQGLRHMRMGVISVTTSGDTLDLTGSPQVVGFAWESVNETDPIALTISGNILTFTGTNGSTGWVHLWTRG